MEILTKKPDLKNVFDVLDLYASDPRLKGFRPLKNRILF